MSLVAKSKTGLAMIVAATAAVTVAGFMPTEKLSAPAHNALVPVASQGLRVTFGDSLDKVRSEYGVNDDPTNDCSDTDPCLMLNAASDGLTFFFRTNDKLLYEIRAEEPFAGDIEGVHIGDALSDVTAKLGQPRGEPWDFGGNKAYLFGSRHSYVALRFR